MTGSDHANVREPLEVRPGARSEATVALEAGCHQTVRIRGDEDAARGLLRVRVLDGAGRCVSEQHLALTHGVAELVLSQLPGHYTVEATTASGRQASTGIDLARTSAASEVVELVIP
ncbi:MAG: hypothetical protein U1E76_27750 [Planctomycetota bacterium]